MIVPTYLMDDSGGRLYADAFIEIAPSYTANATKYAISDKSVINSHVVKQNHILSLTFYVGRNPLKNYAGNLLNGVAKDQRPTTAHEILLKWFNKSTRLTLISEFYQLTNYVVVKYEPKQNQATDSMEYRLILEHVRNVSYTRGKLLEFSDEDKAIDGQRKTSSTGFSGAVNKLPDLYKDGYVNLMGLSNKTNEQIIEDFYNKGK
ncbi:phage baseplate protein [Vibrio diabolicus]